MSKRPNKRKEGEDTRPTKISAKFQQSSSSESDGDVDDCDDFIVHDIDMSSDDESRSKSNTIVKALQRAGKNLTSNNDQFSSIDMDYTDDIFVSNTGTSLFDDGLGFQFSNDISNYDGDAGDLINFDSIMTSTANIDFVFKNASKISKSAIQFQDSVGSAAVYNPNDEYGAEDNFTVIDSTPPIPPPKELAQNITTDSLVARRAFDQSHGIAVSGALSEEKITYAHETEEHNATSASEDKMADINITLNDLSQFASHYVYIYSIYEDVHTQRDGKLYLFGRILLQNNESVSPSSTATSETATPDGSTKKLYKSEELITKSICICVERVDRQMFFLPRKYAKDRYGDIDTSSEVTIDQVKDEIKSIIQDQGIKSEHVRLRVVKKKYAFSRRVATSSFLQPGQQQQQHALKVRTKQKSISPDNGDNFNFDDFSDDDHNSAEMDAESEEDLNSKPDNQGIATAKKMKRDESLQDPINIIPYESAYVELRYPASYPKLPQDLNKTTFSHVFGTQASKQENLIVDRKLSGPTWVRISSQHGKFSDKTTMSWCDFELNVPEARFLEVYTPGEHEPDYQPPLFTSVSLSIKTAVRPTAKNTYEKHIVMATLKTDYSNNIDISKTKAQQLKTFQNTWTIIAPPPDKPLPFDFMEKVKGWNESKQNINAQIHVAPNEGKLLQNLLHIIHQRNPDMIIGHDLHGSMVDVLVSRFTAHNLKSQWSKFGRLKRTDIPKHGIGTTRSLVENGVGAGRLLVDTQLAAREFFPSKQYTLDYLTDQLLESRIKTIEPLQVGECFTTSQSLFDLIGINLLDAESQSRLMHNLDIIPLTKQLTNLCGNTWHSSLRSSRAERVEYLLLHTFARENFIPPEPVTNKPTLFNTVGLDLPHTGQRSNPKTKVQSTPSKVQRKKKSIVNDDGDEEIDLIEGNAIADSDDEEGKEREEKQQQIAVPTVQALKKKVGYSGGKVLEPQRGFYNEWIALLDFNSLYPSIIREYNLCFSTTQHWAIDIDVPNPDYDNFIPSSQVATGILPNVVRMLIDRRRAVRQLIPRATSAYEKQMYHIKQLALKLVANSLYGCLGFASSRFYCRPLAACITSKGRQALDNAVATAGSLGAKIIYGDTDSIMVNTQAQTHRDARTVAVRLKTAINKQYKVLSIDEDGYFKNMLLLRKKKYAAMKLEKVEKYDEKLERAFHIEQQNRLDARKYVLQVMPNCSLEGTNLSIDDPSLQRPELKEMFYFKREVKGLDMVRRDWSNLCRTASEMILDIILRDSGRRDETIAAIKAKMIEVNQAMTDNTLSVENYVITKQLTRSLEQYSDAAKLPHVAVALRASKRGKVVRAGDVIEFIMTSSDSTKSGTQSDRAVSKQDYIAFLRHMKQQEDLLSRTGNTSSANSLQPYLDFPLDMKIDLIYYKEQQLLAPIMRLVDVIEEISQSMLADCLGLDTAKYALRERASNNLHTNHAEEESWGHDNPYEKYRDLPPLYLSCPRCSCSFPFLGVYSYIPYSRMQGYASAPAELRDAINYWTLPFKMHTMGYLHKINSFEFNKTGFICPTPGCPGLFDFGQNDQSGEKDPKYQTNLTLESISAFVCNTVHDAIREYIAQFEQHQFVYNNKELLNAWSQSGTNLDSTQFTSVELKIKGVHPERKLIHQLDIVRFLQYLKYLFDYPQHRVNLQRECDSRLNRNIGTGVHSKQLALTHQNQSKEEEPDVYSLLKSQSEVEVRDACDFVAQSLSTQLPASTWTAGAAEQSCCHLNSHISPEILYVLHNVQQEIKTFFVQNEFYTIDLSTLFDFLQQTF